MNNYRAQYLSRHAQRQRAGATGEAIALLRWLGRQHERAILDRNLVAAIEIDRRVCALADAHPDIWCAMYTCQGQNHLRRLRKLELLHV